MQTRKDLAKSNYSFKREIKNYGRFQDPINRT